MNLQQAYQGWQRQAQNLNLYLKTREAFRKAWFTLPTNKPCSYYTKEVLGTALAQPRVIESDKANAASVMLHVLTFANWAEPKFNPKPDFTFQDLMEYTKGPLADPEKIKPAPKPSIDEEEENDLDIDPVTAMPRKAIEQEEEPKAEPKAEKDMDEKKPRGKQPRKVCQIDAETLQVIRTYDSCIEGCRTTGVKNLDRAIKRLQKAGGYYWQYPEDVPTFAERLKKKQEAQPAQRKQAAPKHKTIKETIDEMFNWASPDDAPVDVEVAVKPKFMRGDRVWAKFPKELFGRIGYVRAFNAMSMSYDVCFGNEIWVILEKDLEQVNEPYEADYIYQQPAPASDGAPSAEETSTRNVDGKTLEAFSDNEIHAELERRGWQGELRRMQIVIIGKK